MKLKLPDGRHLGNNPQGNHNIAGEGYKWRERTHYWKYFLTQISKERSTGPRTHTGKFKSSLNAYKYSIGSPASRISANSMMGQILLLHLEKG